MPITDLTGYTWVGNSIITWPTFMQSHYSLSFTSNNMNFDIIVKFETPDEDYLYYGLQAIYTYDFITNQWTNEAYKTIQITGGTDATNSTLIAWLEANGTLTAPTPSGVNNVSIGTLKLAKALVGSDEVVSMWLGNVKIYEKSGMPDNALLDANDNYLMADNDYLIIT